MTESRQREWSPEELEYLRAHPDEPVASQAAALGRTLQAVERRRGMLGLQRPIAWTDEKRRELVDMIEAGVPVRECARRLGVSYNPALIFARRYRSHGWVCPLASVQCDVCGAIAFKRSQGRAPRTCRRPECQTIAIRRAATEYDRERRLPRPGRSTEAMRRFRQEKPRAAAAAIARRRSRNDIARQMAERHAQPWDPSEDAWLEARPHLSPREAAAELGRTIRSIEARRGFHRRASIRDEIPAPLSPSLVKNELPR